MKRKSSEILKENIRKEGYCAPDYVKEEVFEVKALACGKCEISSYTQFACYVFASNS